MLDHLITTPFLAPPSQAAIELVTTADGVTLRTARWRRTARVSRGTIALFQGRSEFIEKYFEVVRDLRRRGFDVVTLDWRGQGGSERQLVNSRKGHIDDFELFQRDLDTLFTKVIEPHCPKPWFALAHSMGGAALLLALEQGETRFERVVLSSPMIALASVPFPAAAKLLATTLDLVGLGGRFIPGGGEACLSTKPFDGNRLTSDRARYERNAAIVHEVPSLGLGDPTVGWVCAAFRAMDAFADPAFGSRLLTPTLMIYGGADRLCSPSAVAELARRVRRSSAIEIAGARHEIMMESDALRAQFFAAFDAFIPGEVALAGPDPAPAQAEPEIETHGPGVEPAPESAPA